jgi:hypothetical protein
MAVDDRLTTVQWADRQRRPAGMPLILMFHRIGDRSEDPWRLSVSPRHFAQHTEVLHHQRQAVSLGELANRLAAGRSLRNLAVVTFDRFQLLLGKRRAADAR